jgi:hypothetical protein
LSQSDIDFLGWYQVEALIEPKADEVKGDLSPI